MARRPRATASHDYVEAFTWACDDSFTENFFGEALFSSQAEARLAWPQCRRAVWAQTHRMDLPRPAEVFDNLTAGGLEFVRSHWQRVGPFDLPGALAALEEDRANVAAFEQTDGAAAIAEFLALFRHDLDAIEAAARGLATWPGDWWLRPYPHQLSSARTYGEAASAP